MKLIDDLISDLPDVDTDAKIRDVHVGYTWIGILSHNCGVAKNLGERHDYMVRNIGGLTEKTAPEIAEYLKSWNMIEAGIGLAAVNSMIAPRGKELNVTDFLIENGRDKKIAMVGHFPMVNDLRKVADELWVFERQPQKGDLPDTAAEHLIPQADIVAITSSSIINKTIERLLELSQGFTNEIAGRIVSIFQNGPLMRVLVDVDGDEMSVDITRLAVRDLELLGGDRVLLTFKATSVHVIL